MRHTTFPRLVQALCLCIASLLGLSACAEYDSTPQPHTAMKDIDPSNLEIASFGAGCFWCVEAVFENLDGVHSVESGYMGGATENPTYREICTGTTGHAEITQIAFDPSVISYEALLRWLWRSHGCIARRSTGGRFCSVQLYRSCSGRQQA